MKYYLTILFALFCLTSAHAQVPKPSGGGGGGGSSKKGFFHLSAALKGALGTTGSADNSTLASRDQYAFGGDAIVGFNMLGFLFGKRLKEA